MGKNVLKEIIYSNYVRKKIKKSKAGHLSAAWSSKKDALRIEEHLV